MIRFSLLLITFIASISYANEPYLPSLQCNQATYDVVSHSGSDECMDVSVAIAAIQAAYSPDYYTILDYTCEDVHAYKFGGEPYTYKQTTINYAYAYDDTQPICFSNQYLDMTNCECVDYNTTSVSSGTNFSSSGTNSSGSGINTSGTNSSGSGTGGGSTGTGSSTGSNSSGSFSDSCQSGYHKNINNECIQDDQCGTQAESNFYDSKINQCTNHCGSINNLTFNYTCDYDMITGLTTFISDCQCLSSVPPQSSTATQSSVSNQSCPNDAWTFWYSDDDGNGNCHNVYTCTTDFSVPDKWTPVSCDQTGDNSSANNNSSNANTSSPNQTSSQQTGSGSGSSTSQTSSVSDSGSGSSSGTTGSTGSVASISFDTSGIESRLDTANSNLSTIKDSFDTANGYLQSVDATTLQISDDMNENFTDLHDVIREAGKPDITCIYNADASNCFETCTYADGSPAGSKKVPKSVCFDGCDYVDYFIDQSTGYCYNLRYRDSSFQYACGRERVECIDDSNSEILDLCKIHDPHSHFVDGFPYILKNDDGMKGHCECDSCYENVQSTYCLPKYYDQSCGFSSVSSITSSSSYSSFFSSSLSFSSSSSSDAILDELSSFHIDNNITQYKIIEELNTTNIILDDLRGDLNVLEDINSTLNTNTKYFRDINASLSGDSDDFFKQLSELEDAFDDLMNEISTFTQNVKDQKDRISTEMSNLLALDWSNTKPTVPSGGGAGCFKVTVFGVTLDFNPCQYLTKFGPVVSLMITVLAMIVTFKMTLRSIERYA